MFSCYKIPKKNLTHFDNLYKDVISKLPIENRIKYCESLIYRISEDISNSNNILKKRKLKRLLNTAKNELKKMNAL